ncbi:MAG: hypothetical protein FP816_09070 [Desulfobacteraceae bacterium]|nr:hypothetical protein [Desulfobacteraceae bacterium]
MSKSSKKIDTKQISILDFLQSLTETQSKPACENKGRFSVAGQLRDAIRSSIKQCDLSRHQIAGEMSHLCDETITKEQIDSWTRESDELNGHPRRHIPAEYLPALCQVTGSNEPLAIMGKMVGLFVLPGPEALRAEIQRLDEESKKLMAQKKKRMMFLKEMEGDS